MITRQDVSSLCLPVSHCMCRYGHMRLQECQKNKNSVIDVIVNRKFQQVLNVGNKSPLPVTWLS
jgi:hypothetical protein